MMGAPYALSLLLKDGIVVIFVLGGATLEEKYRLEELGKAEGREVFLGTSSCLNTSEMMRYLVSTTAGV